MGLRLSGVAEVAGLGTTLSAPLVLLCLQIHMSSPKKIKVIVIILTFPVHAKVGIIGNPGIYLTAEFISLETMLSQKIGR